MKNKKWTYELNINSDIWHGSICDSREEAIQEATTEALDCDIKKIKIGTVKEVFNYGIDTETVIERIQEEMYEDVGEVAEDYLDDVKKEHLDELNEKLNDIFYEWQKKYNYKPTFYTIEDEEIVEIENK